MSTIDEGAESHSRARCKSRREKVVSSERYAPRLLCSPMVYKTDEDEV